MRRHAPLTPNAAKAILQFTAVWIHDDLGIEYNALRKGTGALNAKGGIDLAKSIDTSTARGQWWLTSTPAPWTNIGRETNTWNQGIIWGSSGPTAECTAWGGLNGIGAAASGQ